MLPQTAQWQVLLAEDSQDSQLIFKLHLRKMQAVVCLAKNGQEALDAYKKQYFDLILMDLQMPVLNGYDATSAIRDWEKQSQQPETPIIALTASATNEEIEKALSVGCNDHLTKPLTREALHRVLVKYEIIKEPSQDQAIPKSENHDITLNKYIAVLDVTLKDLVPKILEIKRQQAQEIERAATQQDFDQIKKLGHKIRGSHGFEYINEIGSKLEAAAKDHDIRTSKIMSDELKEYLDHVEIRFEKEKA